MTSPTAQKTVRTPQEMHGVFKEYLDAGDLDGIMSLYEAGASMVTATGTVTGLTAVRENLAPFIGMKAKVDFQPAMVAQSGDIALVHAAWTGTGTGPDGEIAMSGITAEVVRKQADGSWRYLIDNPGMGLSRG